MPEVDLQQQPSLAGGPVRTRFDPGDIDLPPLPNPPTDDDKWGCQTENASPAAKPGRVTALVSATVLACGIVAAGWFAIGASSIEKQHPNWQHVAAAGNSSTAQDSQVVRVDDSGVPNIAPAVDISYRDIDRATTRKIRSHLAKNDFFAATAALQAAQVIPTADPATQPPVIAENSALAKALENRDNELFEVHLHDCCAEDGDVVAVLVNSVPFATVPISHQEVKLSIPLAKGSNEVTVQGAADGGGGITIALRTSRGTFFCRSMSVGEEVPIGVLVK